MLSFGIAKVVFTLAVIALVWYGSKWRMRVRERAKLQRQRKAMEHEPAEMSSARHRRNWAVEDTVCCTSCGTFVPLRDPRSCGRADCPYPG